MQRKLLLKKVFGSIGKSVSEFLLIGVIVFLSGCSMIDTVRDQWWEEDPQLAAQAAREMIDYELPPGYQELMVLKAGSDIDAVVIAHLERPEDVILIQQLPDGIIGTEYQAEVEEKWSRDIAEHRYDTHTVSTQAVVIRGQSTMLRILEGADETGRSIRQAVCMFTGKSGDVLLVLVAGQDTWDQTQVEQFLQPIR